MDLMSILTAIPTVVGGASIIVQGIAQLTRITPSTKDDEIAGKAASALAKAQRALDVVALNLPAHKARQ